MKKQLLTLIGLIVLCGIGRFFYEKQTQDLTTSNLVLDSVDTYMPSDTNDSKSADTELQVSEDFLTTSKKIGYRYYENNGDIYFENNVLYGSSFDDRFTKKNEHSLSGDDYEVLYCFDDSRMCIYRFGKKYYIDQVEIDLDEDSFATYRPNELRGGHSVVSSVQGTYYVIPGIQTQVEYIGPYSNSLTFLEPNIVINGDDAYSAGKAIDDFDTGDYSLLESDSDDLYWKYISGNKIFESKKVLGNGDYIPGVVLKVSDNTGISGALNEAGTHTSGLREQPVVLKTQDPDTQRILLGSSLGYQLTRQNSRAWGFEAVYNEFLKPSLEIFESMVSKTKTKPVPNNVSWIYMDDSENSGGYAFYETAQQDTFEITGLMPGHVQAVEVIWEGDNESYFLTSYDAAESNRFRYRVSSQFGNIAPGKNKYLIRGYGKSDEIGHLGHELFERIITVEYFSNELERLSPVLLDENQEAPLEELCITAFLRTTPGGYRLQPTRSESQESVFDLGDVQVSIWGAGEGGELNTVQFSTADAIATAEIPVGCGSFSWMNVNAITDEYLEVVAGGGFEGVSKRYLYKIGSDRIENIYEDILLPTVGAKAYRLFTIEGIEENVMTIVEHRYCCDTIENPGGFERYEIDLSINTIIAVSDVMSWQQAEINKEELKALGENTVQVGELYRDSRDVYRTFYRYSHHTRGENNQNDPDTQEQYMVAGENSHLEGVGRRGKVLNPEIFDIHPIFWEVWGSYDSQERNAKLKRIGYEIIRYDASNTEDSNYGDYVYFKSLTVDSETVYGESELSN